jgi:hypothetical protein
MITPQDFCLWTIEQWKEYDSIKNAAYILTPEEITEQERIQKERMINITKEKLASY